MNLPPREGSQQSQQLADIQREIELLKERRRELEKKRLELSDKAGKSIVSPAPSSARGPSRRSASRTTMNYSVLALDHDKTIPDEKARRELLPNNSYREMKEAMKDSWYHDSTLVGGYFLQPDVKRISTFGRERRFMPLQGQKGLYHLSTDIIKMQAEAKEFRRKHLSVANRGKKGCNISSHWNDSVGGGAPGPGAYTPRYQKAAAPSILARR